MKKRILLIFIAFSCAFFSIFTVMPNKKVFASITDYNLVNVPDHDVYIDNYYENEENYGLILLPNVEYRLTFDYNILYTNAPSLRCVVGYGSGFFAYTIAFSDDYSHNWAGTLELTFTTPSSFNVTNPTLFVKEVEQEYYTHNTAVSISNIVVQFADETLSAIYLSGYNFGYYEGSKPYEEDWEVFIFENDSLIDRRWREGHTIENPGSQGNYHRSSALLTLPLGYYRVEQRFLDYTGINRPRFFDPAYSFERDYPPILYLDETSSPPTYFALDFAGNLNDDRYIYFSVPYNDCQVRFQFVANAGEFTAWSASYTSLYQLIELSYDANFNIRYYEIYKRGYDTGKVDGYTEGKNDGIEAGYWNGYNDGREVGYEQGSNDGYNAGYNDGYNAGLSGTINTNWFTSFINSIFNIFDIEIFPNIKLIYLVFIPVGLGVIALILKLIRG